jgi:uncharacterized protein (TIGR02246 family)
MTTDPAREALDRHLILETISRYGYHYDEGDIDAFLDVFTDDAFVDITPDPGFFELPLRGHAAIRAAYAGRLEEVAATAQRRHVQTNTVIHELTPDTARATTFLSVFSVPHGGDAEIRGTGVYTDVLVKRDDRWLLADRRLKMDGLKPDEQEHA